MTKEKGPEGGQVDISSDLATIQKLVQLWSERSDQVTSGGTPEHDEETLRGDERAIIEDGALDRIEAALDSGQLNEEQKDPLKEALLEYSKAGDIEAGTNKAIELAAKCE
ncbi:hypothetical protein KKG41_06640 [Patescibacteria group bacterium]|nr:hypothetical protein [Patescibacteria group bacterium]MBU1890666.1 hypothetical protein [Patescibacteria group bacterium]